MGENGKKISEGNLLKALRPSVPLLGFLYIRSISLKVPGGFRPGPSLFHSPWLQKLPAFSACVLPCIPAHKCHFPPVQPARRCQQDPGMRKKKKNWDY